MITIDFVFALLSMSRVSITVMKHIVNYTLLMVFTKYCFDVIKIY